MKKKILHLHTLPVISGSGINTFLTMKNTLDEYDVYFGCSPGGELVEKIKENNIKFIPVRNFTGPINPIKDIAALFEVKKIIDDNTFDIVHTHNSKAGFIGRVASKISKNRPKVIHTVHGYAFHLSENFLLRFIFRNLERIASRYNDAVIFISEYLRNWAEKDNIVETGIKQYVIPSGIDFNKFEILDKEQTRKKLNLKKDEFLIGVVSKLWKGKGHLKVLKAVEKIKERQNIKVLFIGEGYLKENLKEYALRRNINLEISGFVENVNEYINCLDISILMSDYEGMGRVVLESLACGKCVIVSNAGGMVDFVKDDYNGFILDKDDITGLKDKILLLMENKNLLDTLSQNALKIRQNRIYSYEYMVEKIKQVYKNLET